MPVSFLFGDYLISGVKKQRQKYELFFRCSSSSNIVHLPTSPSSSPSSSSSSSSSSISSSTSSSPATLITNNRFDTGTLVFVPPQSAPVLFEIGFPDRTAAEYMHGDHYRQWGLWLEFANDFPNSVQYRVNSTWRQSPAQWRTQWNYAHVPANGSTVDWLIWFDVPGKQRKLNENSSALSPSPISSASSSSSPSKSSSSSPSPSSLLNSTKSTSFAVGPHGYVQIAFAGVVYCSVAVSLNDNVIAKITDLPRDDRCVYRNSIHGMYETRVVPFDASLLLPKDNRLTLTNMCTENGFGIMYDYVRVELDGYHRDLV